MKKLMLMLLALLMVLSCVSCAGESEKAPEEPEKKEEQAEPPKTEEKNEEKAEEKTEEKKEEAKPEMSVETEVIYCSYVDAVYSSDRELDYPAYSQKAGKVYVDLALKVKNVGKLKFNENYISAYVMYDDARHDMTFLCEKNVGVNFESNYEAGVEAGETGIVHMVTILDEAAKNTSLSVTYKIGPDTKEQPVSTKNFSDPLASKTRVRAGDTVKIGDAYTFEIQEVDVKKYFGASNVAETEQYSFSNSILSSTATEHYDAFFVRIKVTNHTDKALSELYAYTLADGKQNNIRVQIEIKNNTDLTNLSTSNAIPAGGEGIILLPVAAVDSDMIIRFNVNSQCYYVKK